MKQINKSIVSIGLMALMLVFSAQISAKDITYPCQKLIEKGEYDKAKESLSKLRDKDNNNCEVHYGFSKFYMSKDSRYSLSEANKSMKKAEECFQKADEKTLKKLQKIGYSADLFKEEFSKIRQMALQDIQTQKTVASCEVFLNIFPDDEEVPQVKNQQYKFAFADAQKLNTLKAYEDFLFNYPQAPQYAQAQSTVYEMAYAETRKLNTAKAFADFVDKYPEAPQYAQAQSTLYELAYAEALEINTEANYRQYIEYYPESPKIDEVRQLAEKAKIAEAKAALRAKGYVDMELPSGTIWKNRNEEEKYYTYEEAISKFKNELPTKEQFQELIDKCTWTWTGKGYEVVGPNGESIYLPADGLRYCGGNIWGGMGTYGWYWTVTPFDHQKAYILGFSSSFMDVGENNRCAGRSVRLVINKSESK